MMPGMYFFESISVAEEYGVGSAVRVGLKQRNGEPRYVVVVGGPSCFDWDGQACTHPPLAQSGCSVNQNCHVPSVPAIHVLELRGDKAYLPAVSSRWLR
jgi:hypothetical protein